MSDSNSKTDPYDPSLVKVRDLSNFSSVMQAVREAPEMYLGNENKSFDALRAFLNGYHIGRPQCEERSRFIHWLSRTLRHSSIPCETLRRDYGDRAWDEFWNLYDKYLRESTDKSTLR